MYGTLPSMVLVRITNEKAIINGKVREIEQVFVLGPVKWNILENTNSALQDTGIQYIFHEHTQGKFNIFINFCFQFSDYFYNFYPQFSLLWAVPKVNLIFLLISIFNFQIISTIFILKLVCHKKYPKVNLIFLKFFIKLFVISFPPIQSYFLPK